MARKPRVVVNPLGQAIRQWKPHRDRNLAHLSDLGSQYLAIGYMERTAKAGIDLWVRADGDAYDNLLTKCIFSFLA